MAKLLLLLLPLAGLAHASNISSCGGSAQVNTANIIVTGCDQPSQPCIFRKGTMATIKLPFTPTSQISAVKAEVHGILGGVPIPFPLPNSNACNMSGLNCPLVAGEQYTYQASLPIKRIYPSIGLEVKWELKDGDNSLVCIMIDVKLE
uniref:MD2 domain protein general type n=1 Tax=Hemigrapsus sanguineus TaxID=40176 RepID=A0A482KKM1_HEMSA|nr:MD2 domain protein general type [Hemigrapsus sanguineus]